MNETYVVTPYILPMLLSAILPAALALYAWRHRTVPGAFPFVILEVFTALWACFAAVEMTATTDSVKILWFKLEAMMNFPAATALLCFALEYASPGKWLTRRNVLFLSFVPFFTAILIATNDLHHLLWTRLWFDGFVRVGRTPLNLVTVGYGLVIEALTVLVFLRFAIRSSEVYRWQALLLLVATVLPVLTFFLAPMGINPVAPLNPIILILNVNGLLCAFAIYRFGMLNVVPIGRDTAMERMADGVMILNTENQVVDLNPVAQHVLALSRKAIGQPAQHVFCKYPDLIRLFDQPTNADAEITMDRDNQTWFYQVHLSALIDPRGFKLGRLILLHDITEQKHAQAQLLEQHRVVATLQERERLARELHDGLGQMLAAAHLQASSAKRLLAQGANAQTGECLDSLTAMTLEMESEVREHLRGAKTFFAGDLPFFSALRQYLVRFGQQYELAVELTVPPELQDQGFSRAVEAQLARIIQEALSNIRKHARARCVQVNFAILGSQARIVIADDGKGFDPTLLTAQAKGFGLQSLRERAQEVGGHLQVKSRPSQGTQVIVLVPLKPSGEMKS